MLLIPSSADHLPEVAKPEKPCVLAVDDNAVMRKLMSGLLDASEYRLFLAGSAAEAREMLGKAETGPVDCLVTDYTMPGESGLELIVWLRQADPTLASVVMTASDERQVIADCLHAGVQGFLDKPFKRADLKKAVAEAVRATRERRELVRVAEDARNVGRTQHRLFRSIGSRGFDGSRIRHYPRSEAGGDFATVVPIRGHGELLLVADVSGHDMRAAFVSAYFQGLARGMLSAGASVPDLFAACNHFLLNDWNSDGSTPASLSVCGLYHDPDRGRVILHGRGFPVVEMVLDDGSVRRLHAGGGAPLGWFEETEATIPEVVDVAGGGWILLRTDGVDDHAEQLGVDVWALMRAILLSRDERRPPVLDSARDDVLLLRVPLCRDALAGPRWEPLVVAALPGSRSAYIDMLQAGWERSVRLAVPSVPEGRLFDLLVCLREVVLNALVHGCAVSPGAEATLRICVASDHSRLMAVVEDPGPGYAFDWRAHNERSGEDLLTEHRGLAMVHGLADSVVIGRRGARVEMTFSLGPVLPTNVP